MDKLSNLVLDDAEQHILPLKECMENEGVSLCGLGIYYCYYSIFIIVIFVFLNQTTRLCCFHNGANVGQEWIVQMSSPSIPLNSLRLAKLLIYRIQIKISLCFPTFGVSEPHTPFSCELLFIC